MDLCTLYISLVFILCWICDSMEPLWCYDGFLVRENRLLTTMIMMFSCLRRIHFEISLSVLHFFLLLFQYTSARCAVCINIWKLYSTNSFSSPYKNDKNHVIELSIRSDGPYQAEKNTIPNSIFSTSMRFTVMHTNRFLPDSLCGSIIVSALFSFFQFIVILLLFKFFNLVARMLSTFIP